MEMSCSSTSTMVGQGHGRFNPGLGCGEDIKGKKKKNQSRVVRMYRGKEKIGTNRNGCRLDGPNSRLLCH